MKTVDHLFHFTPGIDSLKYILTEGFKPSYARESFGARSILVPMISFSNILLRDVGQEEVLNYGNYAICFTRDWGLKNGINPVAYTYEGGTLESAIGTYFFISLFPSQLERYKNNLKQFSDANNSNRKVGKFSENIALTNTPKEVLDILDYLSLNYDANLTDIIINYANSIRQTTLPIIKLSKPFKVKNSSGKEFIAYNDREWRMIFDKLDFLVEGSEEYDKWIKVPKPHFDQEEFRLRFEIEDVRAILVSSEPEVSQIRNLLESIYAKNRIKNLVDSGSLKIATKQPLEASGF